MATFNNGESGLSVRTKLNEIINKVEGVTSINNNIDVTGTVTADGLNVDGGLTLNADLDVAEVKFQSTANAKVKVVSSTAGNSILMLGDTDDNDIGMIDYDNADNSMRFVTNTAEAMRIDSSGNLLVGKSSQDQAVEGFEYSGSSKYMYLTKGGGVTAYFDRLTSDGDIVEFRKAGTTVGSIGSSTKSSTSRLMIGTGDTGLYFFDSIDAIYPVNTTTGSDRDNAVSLGDSSSRFKDLYLSGGVYLGGTGAANKLDDYERGTWQVQFFDGTTQVSPYRENAEYLKIGDWVWVQGTIEFRTNYPSTSTNQASIQNLPFTVSGDLVAFQHGTVKMYNGGTVTTNMFVTPASFSGTTTLLFHPQGHNSASSWIGGVGCSTISTSVNTAITFNFQYRV